MNLTNCIHIQDDPKKSSDYYIMYNPSTVNLMEKSVPVISPYRMLWNILPEKIRDLS